MQICIGWNNDSYKCKGNFICKKYGWAQFKNALDLESICNCAAMGSKSVKLYVQDIYVSRNLKGGKNTRLLSNYGS